MPEVDLITIVKMVSNLVPRVELMRVVVLKPQPKKWENIEREFGKFFNHSLAVHVPRMDHPAHVLKTRQYIVFLLSSCAFYAGRALII